MQGIKVGDRAVCHELYVSGVVADIFDYGGVTAAVVEVDQPAEHPWLALPIDYLSPVTLQ